MGNIAERFITPLINPTVRKLDTRQIFNLRNGFNAFSQFRIGLVTGSIKPDADGEWQLVDQRDRFLKGLGMLIDFFPVDDLLWIADPDGERLVIPGEPECQFLIADLLI